LVIIKGEGNLPFYTLNYNTMNEFKLPIKKAWQTGSQPVETVAPIISDTNPTGAPAVVGAMWVNTAALRLYVSFGTESVNDWFLIWAD
jgi:hypothetical protein